MLPTLKETVKTLWVSRLTDMNAVAGIFILYIHLAHFVWVYMSLANQGTELSVSEEKRSL